MSEGWERVAEDEEQSINHPRNKRVTRGRVVERDRNRPKTPLGATTRAMWGVRGNESSDNINLGSEYNFNRPCMLVAWSDVVECRYDEPQKASIAQFHKSRMG